jgi:hypothetical protein
MIYLLLAVIVLGLIAVLTNYATTSRNKVKREELRAHWGIPKNEPFNFDNIGRYAVIGKGKAFHQLTSQTIDDIDLHSLFSFVDRTTSKIGQQVLFKKIIQPSGNPVNELQSLIDLMSTNEEFRLDVQQKLSKLSSKDAYFVSSLFHDHLLEQPKWLKFLWIDLAIIFLLLVLSIIFPVCLIFLLLPFTVNMLLHYWNKNNTLTFIRSFPQLSLLVNVAQEISSLHVNFQSDKINESASELRSFQQKVRLLSLFDDGGIQSELSQIGLYFIELLKAFFLVEVFSLFAAVKELGTKKKSIESLFLFVGNLDVAISIASLRSGKLKTCVPEFTTERKSMEVRRAYHPLIQECEENDLSIDGKSILITGSNMSGKTTFLRTLAVNSVLAQSIYTCFAEEFKSPILKQFSSIRIDDNLLEGKSYYMKEVETVSYLVQEAEEPSQKLFFLDEVFKGTNTIERISAGKAVLSFLNQRNHLVIVSTHDLELADKLKNDFDLYHFTETIEDKQLHFDHQIKKGPLHSTNAIRILEIAGFPEPIIAEAKKLSTSIRR